MSFIKQLWSLLDARERRAATILLGLMIIGMTLEMIGVGMILPVLSVMTNPSMFEKLPVLRGILAQLGHPSQAQLIVGVLIGLLLINIVKASFLVFLSWRQAGFVAELQLTVSQRLFEGYLRLPWAFHLQRNSAELIRNVTTEINGFSNGLVIPFLTLCTELTVLTGIAMLLLMLEPLGALLSSIFLGISMMLYYRMTRHALLRWGEERQFHEGQRIKHLQQAIGSVKDVMLLGREGEFIDQFLVHNEAGARILKWQTTLAQLPRTWLELLSVLVLTMLGMTMLAQGMSPAEMVPTFGVFAAAAFRLLPSSSRILWAIQLIRFSRPIVATLYHEMQLIDSCRSDSGDKQALPKFSHIELAGVSFSYPNTQQAVLNDICLKIPRMSSIGIIGESGAGKSTLVDIILGLIKPTSGSVQVGGVDIQQNLRNWQDHLGYVPQTIYLTDDSIRCNVALGLKEQDIDPVALDKAIHAAQLDGFVAELPEGLDTMVGERGVRLSGGQRQRIGIARALYHDPSVLVLDEATSALDNETEREVMDAVKSLKVDKAIIIVAHRLTTLADCDVIYRISKGSLEQCLPQTTSTGDDIQRADLPE